MSPPPPSPSSSLNKCRTPEVSEDFIDAVEARQDAEDAAAAAAEELAAEEPPAPRAQRSIDFTAAAVIIDAEATE